MNTLFLGIVIFLIILAVFDLVVGVSNDAVNFLNSAIGAKVARYRTVEQWHDGRGATRHHDTSLFFVL